MPLPMTTSRGLLMNDVLSLYRLPGILPEATNVERHCPTGIDGWSLLAAFRLRSRCRRLAFFLPERIVFAMRFYMKLLPAPLQEARLLMQHACHCAAIAVRVDT